MPVSSPGEFEPLRPVAPEILAESYRHCGEIARTQAKNFYYAFLALPSHKRDAICAVYAFMRHADDLSDDESLPHAERKRNLDSWLDDWHRADAGQAGNDPTFIALADARRRFHIPMALLDELVQGTTMDLRAAGQRTEEERSASTSATPHLDTYATFDDLYRYCYLVASVVGLVCIRIFGYSDTRAEKLAEETGIAFQLTNILRDVREDALRGRVYLPVEDMDKAAVLPASWREIDGAARITAAHHDVLALQATRAERFYESGIALLPLIDADSRPALWVLITIYRRLLRRIEARDFDVFSARVSVPTLQKLAILGRGMVRTFFTRMGGRA